MVRWTIAVVLALGGALAPVGLSLGAQDPARTPPSSGGEPPRAQLILFLTPADPGLDAVPRELARARDALGKAGGAIDVRFVLLVSDFTKVARETTTPGFIALVRDLAEVAGASFEMRFVDEEGLALAQKLRIERTPAWALVDRRERGARGPRAHVAYGARPRFGEVSKCRSR